MAAVGQKLDPVRSGKETLMENQNRFSDAVEAHDNKFDPNSIPQMMRKFERDEASRRSGWLMDLEVFNLCVALSLINRNPAKTFQWIKGVNKITIQADGGIRFTCTNEFFATRLFDFLGQDLLIHFKTQKIATTFQNKPIRYLGMSRESKSENAES